MYYATFCQECRFFLDQKGGICGQGLSCKEQANEEECSLKCIGPPAQVQGKLASIWIFQGNRRIQQVPKALKFPGSEVIHYEYSRKKDRHTISIRIEIVYRKNSLLPIVSQVLDNLKVKSENIRWDGESFFGCRYVWVEYTLSANNDFQRKRIPQATKRYKKREALRASNSQNL